jgi:hypothetical protein
LCIRARRLAFADLPTYCRCYCGTRLREEPKIGFVSPTLRSFGPLSRFMSLPWRAILSAAVQTRPRTYQANQSLRPPRRSIADALHHLGTEVISISRGLTDRGLSLDQHQPAFTPLSWRLLVSRGRVRHAPHTRRILVRLPMVQKKFGAVAAPRFLTINLLRRNFVQCFSLRSIDPFLES